MILSSNCMIFAGSLSSGSSWWQDLIATESTMVHYLGIIPPVLLARPPEPVDRQHRVRFGIGAGVDPALRITFEKRFGVTLIEIYGMSEIGVCCFDTSRRARRQDAIGRPDHVRRRLSPG